MKVNLCKCGILKKATSECCGTCSAVAVEVTDHDKVKAAIKAANKAAIKAENIRLGNK